MMGTRGRPTSRAGFTLVELLTVMVVLGILANIALPILRGAIVKAEAAAVINDFALVRLAAYERFSDTQDFPPSYDWNQVPPELEPFLQPGFDFQHRPGTDYRWRRWNLPDGMPGEPTMRTVAALDIRSDDVALLTQIRKQYMGKTMFGSGNQITMLLE